MPRGKKPKSKVKHPKPKAGALLISEPFNSEQSFKRTVVLISQHDDRGTIGFVLNKPTDLSVNQVLDDFPEFDAPVYWGGNTRLDSVYYVHTIPDLKGALPIANGLYWGGDFEQLKVMVESKVISPKQIKFIAGYAAWEGKLLEKEIKKNNWWVAEADEQSTLIDPAEGLWGKVLQRTGHVYGIMNDFPEDPGTN
jgi:putative transcriptional regulator